jgi:mannose-1-phosphate guanylyltransferase / mannose-6-phosphate isomerase
LSNNVVLKIRIVLSSRSATMNAPTFAACATPAASAAHAAQPPTLQLVVLAGGAGTRLWPMSREHHPKQLIGLLGDDSLLQATTHRLDGFASAYPVADELLVVCGEAHRFTTAEQLRLAGARATMLLEPVGRDTAPALTLAALRASVAGEDPVLAVMPADHAVADPARFQVALAAGVEHAARGRIATLGIVPTRAETGFGYLRIGAAVDTAAVDTAAVDTAAVDTATIDTAADNPAPLALPPRLDVRRLERFVEKPHVELARQYVDSGEYWWNSGIFIVRASVWLKAVRHYQPAIHDACARALALGREDGPFFRVDPDSFAAAPSNSIDYAVMEPLSNPPAPCEAVAVPLDAGWSDVGSWDALWQISPKDEAGNVARGRVLFEGASATYAHADGRLIACVGTHDLVIVETPDALLVADRARVQDVKRIVGRLKAARDPAAAEHRKVHRPWGHYDSIDAGERFQVKRIVVRPGAQLSLQMHHHRAEHWIVVRGTARITRGDDSFLLSENESTYIPLGVTHRLENPGKLPLELIEVQSGAYLGEDDIVRFEDHYGRP